MYHKILIPTDGSIHSNNALRHAIWIGSELNSDIIVLNVIENHYLELTSQYSLINRMENVLVDNAKDSINMAWGILTEMKIEGKCREDLNLDTKIREGNPPSEIIRMINEEKIDLVVMGKSGKKGVTRFLMGSTALKVIRSAPCSVLTIY